MDIVYSMRSTDEQNFSHSAAGREVNKTLEISGDYRTIQQLVTEKIRNAILSGLFKPNERLNQTELAAKFNVSRIPTREALRILEAEGLVTYFPHRGAVVSMMSPEEIEEVYEIRIVLEASAAQRAVKRMTDAQIQQVRRIQEKMVKAKDVDAWIGLNDLLHQSIYKPSGWSRLVSVIEMLRNLTTPYVRAYVADRSDRQGADGEHAEIVAALEARDGVALKAVLRRHLAHSCQAVLSHLQNRKEGGSSSEEKSGTAPKRA